MQILFVTRFFPLSGVGQLRRLRGGVGHRGAGESVLSVSTSAAISVLVVVMMMVMMETPIRCLCPCRLRWSAGLCCRRPTTSPTLRLCAAWRGSPPPPPPRFVRRGRPPSKMNCWPLVSRSSSNGRMFMSLRAVFGRSCGDKRSPVRARLLESRQLSVRWPADSGERWATPSRSPKAFFVSFALMLCMIQLVNCSSQSC